MKCEGNPGEFQHALVVVDIDKKISKAMRNICIERRKISLLKEKRIMKQFKESIIEIVDDEVKYI